MSEWLHTSVLGRVISIYFGYPMPKMGGGTLQMLHWESSPMFYFGNLMPPREVPGPIAVGTEPPHH